MKHYILNSKITVLFALLVALVSCEENLLDTDLTTINRNEPTPETTLSTPSGFYGFAKGVYEHMEAELLWITWGFHESMGDVCFIPWGNYGSRWSNTPTSYILDNGTTVTAPGGVTQEGQIAIFNSRAAGEGNMTQYEWGEMYKLISQANVMLSAIDNINFTGDAETEKKAATAWALWWKAYGYSRVGSMYDQGLIVNQPGEVSNDYVDQSLIIQEANQILDELIAVLNSVSNSGSFNSTLSTNYTLGILSGNSPNLDSFKKLAYSMKARNILVNKKANEMTSSDWQNVLDIAENGLQIGDNSNTFIMKEESTFLDDAWIVGLTVYGWYFPSPRLIQDFRPGDARLERDYNETSAQVNIRGRGLNFGTQWTYETIENGGSFSTIEDNLGTMYYSPTYEENELMLAEAKIRLGRIDEGLSHLDNVRSYQGANLAPTSGTGLTQDQAIEELRSERRIALTFRGVAFYDARRWGVSSGSRENSWILSLNDEGTSVIFNTNATINYNYLDYWPVTAFETDFNPIPTTGTE